MVRRYIYPPVWLVFGVVAVFACNEFYPVARFTGLASQVVGGSILVIGLALLVYAGGLFANAGTNPVPFKEVTALVTGGIYRYTRNPMYLGMTLVLFGCAVTVGALSALVVAPVFAFIIDRRFIQYEEIMLRTNFPEEYPAYCQRVRRWL